jgi:hypothetical protein
VPRVGEEAAFLGGFVAAEGCFTRTGRRFRFAVSLAATDAGVCRQLAALLRVGAIRTSPRRRPHYDDEVTFAVQSLRELVEVVIPFMDEHLPASHKRAQYIAWRAQLLDYWVNRAKRRRPCSEPDCGRPRRARGLCRHHYYEAQGR